MYGIYLACLQCGFWKDSFWKDSNKNGHEKQDVKVQSNHVSKLDFPFRLLNALDQPRTFEELQNVMYKREARRKYLDLLIEIGYINPLDNLKKYQRTSDGNSALQVYNELSTVMEGKRRIVLTRSEIITLRAISKGKNSTGITENTFQHDKYSLKKTDYLDGNDELTEKGRHFCEKAEPYIYKVIDAITRQSFRQDSSIKLERQIG